MIAVRSLPRSRAAAHDVPSAWLVVGSLVVLSATLRSVAALWHTAARVMPDEYIYASLSRSLLHGHLEVHGQTALFPALLQPLLAAPAWALLPVYDAYRVVQFENAVAASLVVLPLWMLARDLGLPSRTSYLACVYALVVPMLAWVPVTISDFVAYPLVVAAVAWAVRSLDRPSPRRQTAFLAFALLATFARVQYFVLIPAYLAAAVVLERRAFIRQHALVVAGSLPALVALLVGLTGFYSFGSGSFDAGIAKWVPLQAYFLAVVAGAVLVPGALAATIRPSGRRATAFAVVFGALALLLLAQASVFASHDGRFRERYLFALLPLVAVAFALHLQSPRAGRRIALATAVALIVAAARVTVSTYTAAAPSYDTQSMTAAWSLQRHVGAFGVSAIVTAFVTLSAGLAILIAYRGRGRTLALPLAIVFGAAMLGAAMQVDLADAPTVEHPTWIDEAAGGARVTAVETPTAKRIGILKQLYFNPSVKRELVMSGAVPTDSYATERTSVTREGHLRRVRGYFVFDQTATHVRFANAERVASNGPFTLFHSGDTARLRLLVESRLTSGMLEPHARLRAWPSGGDGGTVSFTLTRAASADTAAHVQLKGRRFLVAPGRSVRLICTSRQSPVDVEIFSPDLYFAGDQPVTVRLSDVSVATSRGLAPGCTLA